MIKTPMDLGTVETKLNGGKYATVADFAADVELIFNNAKIFNTEGSDIFELADGLARAGRWLLVAAGYTIGGVALCLAMFELYFGSAEADCQSAAWDRENDDVETLIGALPILLRHMLLTAMLPASWMCRRITGYGNDQPGLVRALLVGYGAGDGQAPAAGGEASVGTRARGEATTGSGDSGRARMAAVALSTVSRPTTAMTLRPRPRARPLLRRRTCSLRRKGSDKGIPSRPRAAPRRPTPPRARRAGRRRARTRGAPPPTRRP